MGLEVTTGIISSFNPTKGAGKFKTTNDTSYDFTLAVVKDDALRERLQQLTKPLVEIPVNVALYSSDSHVTVVQITRQPLVEKPAIDAGAQPSLPAEPGPYRDAKELYHAGDYKRAQERFLEAIRLGDRRPSAVKDLASMLNQRGKCEEAVILINQFLLTQEMDSAERTRFTNLRDNIHNRLAKGQSSPGAAKFSEQIKKILTNAPAAKANTTPPPDPAATNLQRTFFCLKQIRCFPLGPRRAQETIVAFDYPKNAQFTKEKAWTVGEVNLTCDSKLTPLPSQSVRPIDLQGHWVLALADSLWRPSIQLPVELPKGSTVFLRDGKVLAGPWSASDDGVLISEHSDHVCEWQWSDDWQRLDFPDRTYLLDTPNEQEAGFFDFLDDQLLASWFETKVAQAGPEVAAQFEQLTQYCHKILTGPLDASRWERLRTLLEKPCQRLPEQDPIEVAPGVKQESYLLVVSTATCRCLLVPSLAHSIALGRAYAANTEHYLITPSVAWLGLRDAWPELEWVWNYAHAHPERLVLLHFEQANLTLLHHWAKPLLNAAHGLCSSLPGLSELPWPHNLRTHWSLSNSPEAFPVAPQLHGAFGAVPMDLNPGLEEDTQDQRPFPLEMMEVVEPVPELKVAAALGDFRRAAAREVAALQRWAQQCLLGTALATQIRLTNPHTYWSLNHAH